MCPRSGWSLRPFAEPGRRHLTSPFVVLRLLSSSFCVHHLVAAFTWIFISLLLLLLLRFWQAALCSKLVTSMQPERPTKKSPRSMSGGPIFFVCNFSKKKKKGARSCRHCSVDIFGFPRPNRRGTFFVFSKSQLLLRL